jgi:hypothetical protein
VVSCGGNLRRAVIWRQEKIVVLPDQVLD